MLPPLRGVSGPPCGPSMGSHKFASVQTTPQRGVRFLGPPQAIGGEPCHCRFAAGRAGYADPRRGPLKSASVQTTPPRGSGFLAPRTLLGLSHAPVAARRVGAALRPLDGLSQIRIRSNDPPRGVQLAVGTVHSMRSCARPWPLGGHLKRCGFEPFCRGRPCRPTRCAAAPLRLQPCRLRGVMKDHAPAAARRVGAALRPLDGLSQIRIRSNDPPEGGQVSWPPAGYWGGAVPLPLRGRSGRLRRPSTGPSQIRIRSNDPPRGGQVLWPPAAYWVGAMLPPLRGVSGPPCGPSMGPHKFASVQTTPQRGVQLAGGLAPRGAI